MSHDNISEQDRQEYGKRKAKYFLLAIGALALSLLFSCM